MFGFSDVGWSFYRHTNSGRLQHDGREIKTGHLDLTDVCEWIFNFTVRCSVWCHWGWIVILQTHVTNSGRLQHRGRRVETGFLNALTDVSTWLISFTVHSAVWCHWCWVAVIFTDMSRTVLGCSIAAAAVMLACLISLMCGVWPARCDPIKRPRLYLATSILLLLASEFPLFLPAAGCTQLFVDLFLRFYVFK